MTHNRLVIPLAAVCAAALAASTCFGLPASAAALPSAPTPQAGTPAPNPAAKPESQVPPPLPAPARMPAPTGPRLTLKQAEQMALQNNPNISVAHLLQLADVQVTREARAGYLPNAWLDLTAVGSHENSRITAGALNSPHVFDKAAGGLSVDQLITDFGRTHNLIKNARSTAQAQFDTQRATVDDITLAVDQAYYQALTAQEVLKVAEQTVATRQATGQQIGALTNQNLRSTLDLSLADVQISQAQLLVLDAQNAEETALASLNAILGSEQDTQYRLVDETPDSPEAAPADAEAEVQLAFRSRPDLAALNERYLAARQFASAEHDLLRPTISALATAGAAPVRDDLIQSSWYGAAGANVSIPVFNGFAFTARAHAADLQAKAASEDVRNMRDNIARDVRAAVLSAQTAFRKIAVNKQLLEQANTALELAQARYKVGLSGIVDLTQSQLAQTEALIGYTNARFAYQTALSMVRYQTGQ